MKTIRNLLLCPLAATLFAATGANAASIKDDTFEANALFDFSSDGGASETVGPFTGVAGAVDDGMYPGDGVNGVPAPDIFQNVTVDGIDYTLGFNWVDADSFEFFLNGFGAPALQNFSFTLSGLAFKSEGLPVDIIGATFNRTGSILDEENPGGRPGFEAGKNMPNPSVSFTSSSVTATFGFIPSQLVGDGPLLRFDVQPDVVPEPGTLAILVGGLAVLGLARRRGARRAS